jgi:hypothetical protein
MAVTAEFLNPLFEGIEGGEERIQKILSEYDTDVIGLKRKNEELLGSVKQHTEKHDALQKEKTALETAMKELDEKLKANLPDKERKAYEEQIVQHQSNAAKIAEELNQKIVERENRIKGLEAEHHRYICHAEFNKLINDDPTIIPEMREVLETVFFAHNEFEWVEISGEKRLLNKASRSMKDVLSDFLNTPAGQRFRADKSTGGGAIGSKSTTTFTENPWVKGKENLTKQARILNENPAQAAALMAAAGVSA